MLAKNKTKIVATIGPASCSPEVIERMIKAGLKVARLNLSHGTVEEHHDYVKTVRSVSKRMNCHVSILIDLPGLKYRTGEMEQESAELKKGKTVTLTIRQVKGSEEVIPIHPFNIPHGASVGDVVLVDDGAIQLKITQITETDIICKVVDGGVVTKGRGVVIPGLESAGEYVNDELLKYLDFAVSEKPEFIALSFVSKGSDVRAIRCLLEEKGCSSALITKIERGQAVSSFDEILKESDGIMVARGDLGVDIPLQKVPLVQKEIIKKCNIAGKPVITATQMLESMINAPRPTRAEVTDVANAIFDGTDAIMLSAETSIGKYPARAVKMMSQVSKETELRLPYGNILKEREGWLTPKTDDLISFNAVHISQRLKVKAIVAFTQSGFTAGRVSKYRPEMPVVGITPNREVFGKLLLNWGVMPVQIKEPSSVNELFKIASETVKKCGLANEGDLIVITGGAPIGVPGNTNLLKVQTVE